MSAVIRPADETDAEQILSIYSPIVTHTAISFEVVPPTVAEMRARISNSLQRLPWLVCSEAEELLGYAYASQHRQRAAYQWSVDVSVYVRADVHRRGVGRNLYGTLFEILRSQGYYTAYAGITLPNEASIGLHTRLGFEPVGVYRGVGYKLGRWHDVSWWQLMLRAFDDVPSPPRAFATVRDPNETQESSPETK
jgi:phosphinothricin acetyltransferase